MAGAPVKRFKGYYSIIDGNLEYYEDIILKKGLFSGLFTKYKMQGIISADAVNIVLMRGIQLHIP